MVWLINSSRSKLSNLKQSEEVKEELLKRDFEKAISKNKVRTLESQIRWKFERKVIPRVYASLNYASRVRIKQVCPLNGAWKQMEILFGDCLGICDHRVDNRM